MRKPWSWSKVLIILALTVVTLAALPAAQAQASFAHGAVVALQGTPHLWIADEHGVLHWGGDTRALAGKHVNWGDRTEVSLEQLRTLPVGDPWLSAGLLKDGDPIYLVKWESDWAQPQLLHIQSIKDVELFGINGSNYGNFVLDKATWEAQLGLSAAGLQRGVLAAAVPASERAATVGLQRGTPNWVFAGNVPDAERTALREEIEAVRTWYSDQYGVEATDLTVLVGATAEALASEFRDVTGRDLLGGYVPPGYSGPSSLLPDPFITTADDGSPVIVLIYGSNPFDKLKDSIVHEYFHALQNQLLASRYQVSEVEPYWLVEGLAMYTDHAYSQSRPGRRPFLGDNGRMTPYEDLADAISLSGIITPRYLENIATESTFRDGFALHPIYTYALAFAGAHFLVGKAGEDSVVEFWRLIQQRPTWQQAFGEAFGMGIEDFYDLFAEWLPEQLPSYVQFSVWLHWQGKEALPADVLNRLRWNTSVSPEDVIPPPSDMSWGGSTAEGAHTITYTAGESWTGRLGLWFQTDQCTEHLLGWYKDGELTDQRTEATVVQVSGESSSLDWTIPARPDTLPRLQEMGRCN